MATTNEVSRSRGPRVLLVVGVVIVLAVVAVTVAVVVGRQVTMAAEPARAEAESFTRAWSAADVAAMQAMTEPGATVAEDLAAVLGPARATRATMTLGKLSGEGDRRTAEVAVELAPEDLDPVAYTTGVPLHRGEDGVWRVTWSRAVIHPAVPPGGRLDRARTWPTRPPILDAQGQPLSTAAGSVAVSVRPADVVDRPGLEAALRTTLGIDQGSVDKAFTAARAAPSGQAPIRSVPRAEYDKAKATIYPIKGLSFDETGTTRGIGGTAEAYVVGRLGKATAEQAAALGAPYEAGDDVGVSGVQAGQQKALGGTPAVELRIVDAAGAPVQSLQRREGSLGTPVRTTLDRRIQAAAEQTLSTVAAGKNAALVAVDRAGGIKAMALPGATGFNWATGTYPPGSTFKVVTAAALLQKGLTGETALTCPITLNAAGSTYRNFEDETEPSLTFARAFAISCNTAFIGATQQLSGTDMHQMAARFGFNVDYDAGLPMAVRGKFPDDGAGAARSAQAIGQGSVLSNPVHMASVAAAALTGRWQAPSLLADRAGLPSGEPLDPRVAETLARFMRETVEYGTGKPAAVPGKVVAGKTGTAEIGPGPEPETHAWFIGFSGDLAVAVVVDKGGVGGEVAAPIAGNFFARLG